MVSYVHTIPAAAASEEEEESRVQNDEESSSILLLTLSLKYLIVSYDTIPYLKYVLTKVIGTYL